MATKMKEKPRERKKKHKTDKGRDEDLEPPPSISGFTNIIKQENTTYLDSNIVDNLKTEPTVLEDNETIDNLEILGVDNAKETLLHSDSNKSEILEQTTMSILRDVETTDNTKNNEEIQQDVVPSAPIIEETCSNMEQLNIVEDVSESTNIVQNLMPSMPLEEAERLFCGNQISLVKIINEKESKAVEDSIMIDPNHPLVDLLSTYKCSLIAVERERKQLIRNYHEENTFRSSLWKIERREIVASEKCTCGSKVQVKFRYDRATFLREKLPVAKMKLESLARDVQESYCHQLHSVLLAHYQIEGFIYDILHTTNSQVRTALSLVLEALRTSGSAPQVLAEALQRWATALVAGLLRYGHLADLLFVCHHLYRQNRSVYWAGREMSMSAGDLVETARIIGLLQVILTAKGRHFETATECTEDIEQVWEEVDKRGSGCVVSSDSLRERDMLMILEALSLRDVIARLALVRHQNINDLNELEWGDESGGRGVIKAICGSRVFLNALHQGVLAHPYYNKLAENISVLAVESLRALADLHDHSKSKYDPDLITKISSELESAFRQAWSILVSTGASVDQLPFDVLSYATSRNYLAVLTNQLHDDPSAPVSNHSLQVQTDKLGCHSKLTILAQMAVSRREDNELAKSIIHFLIHESFSTKVTKCSQNCEQTARGLLKRVLCTHPYLYAETICTFATFRLGEEIERSNIEYLSLVNWVPGPHEVLEVLWKVTQKLPVILPDILMALDFSPQTGLPLETQLSIASFLCKWTEDKITNHEWRWTVLRRLKIHRSEWGSVLDVPTPESKPEDLYSKMATLLATSWGHCVPMICEYGVQVLCALSRAGRVRDAVHCLQYVTRVMADAPESIAFTPMFGELCNTLTDSGPSFVQRALGRGGVSGHTLLLNLMIEQLHTERRSNENTMSLFAAWLYLCRAHPQLVEVAFVCCYDCLDLEQYVSNLLQDEELLKHLSATSTCNSPTLSLHMLRISHTLREVAPGTWARLLVELHAQRCRGAKIHVDNAVQLIEADFRSEDLVIYKAATAVLATPHQHPSHLLLWRLFFSIYLQRPPSDMHENSSPIGPLFFEGIIKSRTLQQLKKKLQDAITYHRTEYEKQQSPIDGTSKPVETSVKPEITVGKTDEFAPLPLVDMIGEAVDEESSSDEEESPPFEEVWVTPRVVVNHALVKSYHHDAAIVLGNYLRWLMDGYKTRELPHHAELSRYISAQALNAAWKLHLKTITPPREESNQVPKRLATEPYQPPSQRLKLRLQKIKSHKNRCKRPLVLRPPIKDVPTNRGALVKYIEKLLDAVVKFAGARDKECTKLAKLDSSLWTFVGALWAFRGFDPVTRICSNKCKHITMCIQGEEWCISPNAEREIEHNRMDALQLMVRLARPQPQLATTTAALQTISRMVPDIDTAVKICDKAWRSATDSLFRYPPARDAYIALVTELAQKYISKNGVICSELTRKWCEGNNVGLRQALCTALVSPQALTPDQLPLMYRAVLHARLPPHVAFSQLSKFEIPKWVAMASHPLKQELLDVIISKLQLYGILPEETQLIVVELLCVHMASIVDAHQLRWVVSKCARATADGSLPHPVWKHMTNCAQVCGVNVPPEEMTMIFYELAKIWHETGATGNTKLKKHPTMYTTYVSHYAATLRALTHALRRSLLENPHNTPEHVSLILWSCSVECWSPWILGRSKLLPPIDQHREDMLNTFLQTLSDVYSMVPAGASVLLQEIFKWVGSLPPNELDSLLPSLSKMPWSELQWFHGTCLPTALKLSTTPEARIFLYDVTRGLAAGAWLVGVSELDVAPHLAALLSLLSTAHLSEETLKRSICLPWHRLPLMALEPELDRFFTHHYSASVVYHKLPQFVVIRSASEMVPTSSTTETTLPKRRALLSYWLRAVTSPLPSHVHRAEVSAMLTDITLLYGETDENCDKSQNEIVEILNVALTVFCTEPAAASVLSVWLQWLATSPKTMVQACVRSVLTLTSYKYYTQLADPVLKAYFAFPGSSWLYVRERWSACMFAPHSPASAYARAVCRGGALVTDWIRTMVTRELNFVQEETPLALWVCLIVRSSLEAKEATAVTDEELGLSLLSCWAQDQRLSLLKTLTMSSKADKPTPKLRLLARLALCILRPSEVSIKMYEASHGSLLSNTADTASWGRTPNPKRLPSLAVILFPNSENFFKLELDLTSNFY